MMKRLFILIALAAILLPSTHLVHAQVSDQTATVFFNEACQDCGELVQEMYPMLFAEYGYTLELHDYINERSNRALLTQTNDAWGVPFELQSHIETFIDDRLLIGGHVPEATIRYLLENPDAYDRLLVYQDAMHGEETEYRVWDFEGDIMTYVIDEPITTYLEAEPSSANTDLPRQGFWGLFAVITGSAFLDGLNPCAFAVLLFFISFLFTMKKTRASIWKMGLVYIAAIFLAYLLIGLGIAQAIVIAGAPHLMAKIGAYLVIGLGVIQLAGVLFPAFPIRLRIPIDTKATLEKWMYKATLPASFVGGFLVGLCTFPCSGGIYVAIIGMLSAQSSLVEGTSWMLWYNLIFVSPLLILLALASNPKATEHLQKLERAEARNTKLLIGGFMIALGAIILVFFT
ncbi:MAG: cytochrome c biogenesis protein CcdA [Patescibacteria group bacterium]